MANEIEKQRLIRQLNEAKRKCSVNTAEIDRLRQQRRKIEDGIAKINDSRAAYRRESEDMQQMTYSKKSEFSNTVTILNLLKGFQSFFEQIECEDTEAMKKEIKELSDKKEEVIKRIDLLERDNYQLNQLIQRLNREISKIEVEQ